MLSRWPRRAIARRSGPASDQRCRTRNGTDLIVRNHDVDEPESIPRLTRANRPTEEQHFAGQTLTHDPHEARDSTLSCNHSGLLSAVARRRTHPRSTSGYPSLTLSPATSRSRLQAISSPPPKQAPFSAPIIGLLERQHEAARWTHVKLRLETDPNPFLRSATPSPPVPSAFRLRQSVRSWPAQKARPFPVRMQTQSDDSVCMGQPIRPARMSAPRTSRVPAQCRPRARCASRLACPDD